MPVRLRHPPESTRRADSATVTCDRYDGGLQRRLVFESSRKVLRREPNSWNAEPDHNTSRGPGLRSFLSPDLISSVLKAKNDCPVVPRQNMHQNQLGNFEVTSIHTSGNVNLQISGIQVWEIRKALLVILIFTKSLWFQPPPGENVSTAYCYMQAHVLPPD